MGPTNCGDTNKTEVNKSLDSEHGTLKQTLLAAPRWVVMVPALAWLIILGLWRSPLGWITEKPIQEIIGPGIIALACLAALTLWVRRGEFHWLWLALLTGSLFCREYHFAGSGIGIYFALAAVFWYGSRRIDNLRELLAPRIVVFMVVAAICTYFTAKTFDHGVWKFIPGERDWHNNVEESMETTGHLWLLATILIAGFVCTRTQAGKLNFVSSMMSRLMPVGRFAVLVVSFSIVVKASDYWHRETSEPRTRAPGRLPEELSSVCKVNEQLGAGLYLAGSDDERKLYLWRFSSKGQPICKQVLPMKVELDGDKHYELTDLEDLAWDGVDTYYAVGSHRHLLPKENEARLKESRLECAIVSFQIERTDDRFVITNARTVTRDLLQEIRAQNIFPSVNWKRSKIFRWESKDFNWQIDIEGLAYVDGQLLLGFKNPIEDGKSTILSFDIATNRVCVAARANLRGQGILALDYDLVTEQLFVVTNHPYKHCFGDSCLWVGTRGGTDGNTWRFAAEPNYILEHAAANLGRKASGITRSGNNFIVSFDDPSAARVAVIPADRVLQ